MNRNRDGQVAKQTNAPGASGAKDQCVVPPRNTDQLADHGKRDRVIRSEPNLVAEPSAPHPGVDPRPLEASPRTRRNRRERAVSRFPAASPMIAPKTTRQVPGEFRFDREVAAGVDRLEFVRPDDRSLDAGSRNDRRKAKK